MELVPPLPPISEPAIASMKVPLGAFSLLIVFIIVYSG